MPSKNLQAMSQERPNHYTTDYYKNFAKQTHIKYVTAVAIEQPPNSNPHVINDDIASIIKQVLSGPATAIFATSSNSCYFLFSLLQSHDF